MNGDLGLDSCGCSGTPEGDSSVGMGLGVAFSGAPACPRGTGWLRHGNPPGDLRLARRCGARTRAGGACRQPAMRNGRCRLHGGKSTGPRTSEGRERSRRAHLRHGLRGRDYLAVRREGMALRRRVNAACLALLAALAVREGHPAPRRVPYTPAVWVR
jgi:hypothetical protein